MEVKLEKLGLSPEDLLEKKRMGFRFNKKDAKTLIRIYENGNGLNLSDIISLERDIGYAMPKDYIEFLIKYNGGSPLECKIKDKDIIIDYFLAFKSEYKIYSLVDLYYEYFSQYGLPIATTPGDDYLILSRDGKIYYFDHENPYYDGEKLELIFNSFTELLENLTDESDDDVD